MQKWLKKNRSKSVPIDVRLPPSYPAIMESMPSPRLSLALVLAAALPSVGQQPIAPAPPDPAIAAALQQISPAHIYSDIAKLVTFNNRSTLSSAWTPTFRPAPARSPHPTGSSPSSAASPPPAITASKSSATTSSSHPRSRSPELRPSASPNPPHLVNVYAVLKGSDPAQANRRVLVTGHYDSRNTDVMNTHDPAPGANDDASGVAVSLECARVLTPAASNSPPPSSSSPSTGRSRDSIGSRHLARLAKSEGWDLQAVLNNDIVGGDTTPGDTQQDKTAVRVFSEGVPGTATLDRPQRHPDRRRRVRLALPRTRPRHPRHLRHLLWPHRRASPPPLPAARTACSASSSPPSTRCWIFRRDRFLRGGDHTSFNLEGFPAVRFTEWRENFNHQHQDVRTASGVNADGTSGPVQFGDLIQFVDPSYIANVARLNAATLATLALAPGPPRNVHVLTMAVDNNTMLTWEPPAGFPANASYEIVSRDTTAPTWTMVQSGQAATLTSPSLSPKTTSSSASARSTPPGTAARPSTPRPPAPQPSPRRRQRSRPPECGEMN